MNELSKSDSPKKETHNTTRTSEPALVILWEKCGLNRDDTYDYLSSKFGRVIHKTVKWSSDAFSSNLTRFYGEKLPPKSHKEVHIGSGKFDVFIFEDQTPIYQTRLTSRGPECVNTNLFDLKTSMRNLDGGGHKVHGTINAFEGERDIWLLFGKTPKEILSEQPTDEKHVSCDLIGSECWKDLAEVLTTLNKTVKYVVIRNFDSFPDGYDLSKHGDIDFLVSDLDETANILNAQRVYPESHRVHYLININGVSVPVDIRSLDDDYYDPYWSRDILQTRVKQSGFYTPNDQHHFYSLLYHGLIHKREVASDYKLTFSALSTKLGLHDFNLDTALNTLKAYMLTENYQFVRPSDLSVYFAWDKVALLDQADYYSQVEKHILTGLPRHSEKISKKERQYQTIAFGPLTDRLFDFYKKTRVTKSVTALICPQFDTDFEKLTNSIEELVIICANENQKSEFEKRTFNNPKVRVFNLVDDKITQQKFDFILIANSLDLFPKSTIDELVDFIYHCLHHDGTLSVVVDQIFHIDQFISNSNSNEKFLAEEIQGKPRSVNRLRIEPNEFFNKLAKRNMELDAQFGIYPNCNTPTYICCTKDMRAEYSLADMISAVGPSHPNVNKCSVFETLENQMALPSLFRGQIYNFSKSKRTSSVDDILFAKFSIRDHDTSTMTLARNGGQGIYIEKTRTSGSKDKVKNVPISIGKNSHIIIEHHSNSLSEFVPGTKLSTKLENALLANDIDNAVGILSMWGRFIVDHGNLSHSRGTVWENFDEYLISGRMFDLGPHNLILNGSNVRSIDDEWQTSAPMPLCWYIARNSKACTETFSSLETVNFNVIIQKIYQLLGLKIDNQSIAKCLRIEQIFQETLKKSELNSNRV